MPAAAAPLRFHAHWKFHRSRSRIRSCSSCSSSAMRSANLLPARECGGHVLQLDSGISVEQFLPRRGIEVYDGFILRVDHRQVRRNLFQHCHGRGLIIDEDPSLAARSNLAPQESASHSPHPNPSRWFRVSLRCNVPQLPRSQTPPPLRPARRRCGSHR